MVFEPAPSSPPSGLLLLGGGLRGGRLRRSRHPLVSFEGVRVPPFTFLLLLVLRLVVGRKEERSVFRSVRSSLAREVLFPPLLAFLVDEPWLLPQHRFLGAQPFSGLFLAWIVCCATFVRDRAEGAEPPARVASSRLSFVTSPRDRSSTRISSFSRLSSGGGNPLLVCLVLFVSGFLPPLVV